jgi:hypothetical protein
MKEILLGIVLMALISFGAAMALGTIDMSARAVYQAPANVRL